MIPYPNIDPIILKIGPLALRWYGLMYVLGFAASYLLTVYQVARKKLRIDRAQIDDLYFWLIIGLMAGARLGYVVFYNLPFYFENPLEIFVLWHGGMSFHGGLIGCVTAAYVVMKKRRMPFLAVTDVVLPSCPIGLGLGRMGNFINGELFGKPSDLPWAMVFPQGGTVPRHPSQLYEALLEGPVLFLVLWIYKDRKRRDGDVLALFLVLYGVFRGFCEFFREPDVQVGYILGTFTMGQVLSGMMVLAGLFLKFLYLPNKGKH
jgi:phosphatidylglycerol:prolipoprotein diacylglycerol transferase